MTTEVCPLQFFYSYSTAQSPFLGGEILQCLLVPARTPADCRVADIARVRILRRKEVVCGGGGFTPKKHSDSFEYSSSRRALKSQNITARRRWPTLTSWNLLCQHAWMKPEGQHEMRRIFFSAFLTIRIVVPLDS